MQNAPTNRPTNRSLEALALLFESVATRQDTRAANTAASTLRDLVADCLYLPTPARSYREDCLQELTFGLYELLRRWHADGRLAELRSVVAFVKHYVKWHAPSVLSGLAFRLSSRAAPQYPLAEGQLAEGVSVREMSLTRDESGCHHTADVGLARDAAAARVEYESDVAALGCVDRRIVELAGDGETGRRRIEMCLVAEFGLSHRQARRAVDDLPDRLRA